MPNLYEVNDFRSLVAYLANKLDWPVNWNTFEDLDELTFEYDPEELGLPPELCAKVREVKQMRPLTDNQPWAVFYLSFESKRLPVTALRRILNAFVEKKRAASGDRATWKMQDLLFVNSHGGDDDRAMTFAHFTSPETGKMAVMREFMWSHRETHLVHIERYLECLHWPEEGTSQQDWRKQWRSAFVGSKRKAITDSRALAQEMAHFAYEVRQRVSEVLELSRKRQSDPLQQLYASFQKLLIHDLKEADFADAYAQTMAYGLFAARAANPDDEFSLSTAPDKVPPTNPFLRGLFRQCLGLVKVGAKRIDIEELGVRRLVELFTSLQPEDMKRILDEFGSQTGDPVIHFYEDFLTAYDKDKKIQRGVFYTPKPAVTFIVRSVHELMQTEFGLEDGLAATVTWGDMLKRFPDLKLPKILIPHKDKPEGEKVDLLPQEFFVMILDIATGTATFLIEVIDTIFTHLKNKWEKTRGGDMPAIPTNPGPFKSFKEYWNAYVPVALLPRLYGYELMMAPYTIAHMKLGLKLADINKLLGQPDYQYTSKERAHIYLTNSLEPVDPTQKILAGIVQALADEATAVNDVKRCKRFTVYIGNPPYAGHSSNTGDWITDLINDYYNVDGRPLGERNSKWLQDDYVKFIRLGQYGVERTGFGIQSYITNHGYIDNPTFRGMRHSLLTSFSELRILDLHGNIKKKETTSNGGVDENVFDIQQGVAVFVAVRGMKKEHVLKQYDVFGTRVEKYSLLANNTARSLKWQGVKAVSPFYVFRPQDEVVRAEYLCCHSIKQVMSINVLGFQTHRDGFAIAFDRETIISRCEALRDPHLKDSDIKTQFGLKDNRDWNVHNARKEIRGDTKWGNRVIRCLYRPFDVQGCYFSTVAMDYPRRELLNHVAEKENLCLLVPRQISFPPWRHCSVSNIVAESCLISLKSKEGNYNFPLYLYPENGSLALEVGKRVNFSDEFLRDFAATIKISQNGPLGLPMGVSPEDIFHYIYGLLHSPGYRNRYMEFLKIDFPRLPLPSNLALFRALAKLGGELVALHLMKSAKLERFIATYIGPKNHEVGRVGWSDNTVWLDAAATKKGQPTTPGTVGFRGVPEEVWNFHIGGYQVCEKWLKDRKGRTLNADDISHYQKIVVALAETISLMGEIDEVIEEHGGWPGAFTADRQESQ